MSPQLRHNLGMDFAGGCSNQCLGHSFKYLRAADRSSFGDQASASRVVGRGVWLWLGADESQPAHSLWRLSPQLQEHVASN